MGGTPTWKREQIAFVRAYSRHKELSDEDIATKFNSRFPNHKVTASSVSYCISHYVDRVEYDPQFWLGNFPGKKGYFMGLSESKFPHDEIIRRIEHRYPSHKWPGTDRTNENQKITKREAVEIAIATFDEHAPFYGETSLRNKYPHQNEATAQRVLQLHRQGRLPDDIHINILPRMEYDDIIYILTRFADGFANRYLNDLLMIPVSELLPHSSLTSNAVGTGDCPQCLSSSTV